MPSASSDRQSVDARATPRGRLMQSLAVDSSARRNTVFLVTSSHPGWIGLRHSLARLTNIYVLGESDDTARIEQMVTSSSPDLIFVPDRINQTARHSGRMSLDIIAGIHASSPSSKVLVGTEHMKFDEALLFLKVGIDGLMPWRGLTPEGVSLCVASVLGAGLWVAGGLDVRHLFQRLDRERSSAFEIPELQPHERAVLLGIAAGMTEAEIATSTHLSRSTVKRVLSVLEQKLAVPNRAVLLVKATQIGLLSQLTAEPNGPDTEPLGSP